jgi:hypothetical protein
MWSSRAATERGPAEDADDSSIGRELFLLELFAFYTGPAIVNAADLI